MRNWISKNFLTLVIGALVIILLLRNNTPTHTTVKADTTINNTFYIKSGDTTINKPIERQIIRTTVVDTSLKYKSDSELVKMIQDLRSELLSEKLYSDTFNIDTLGKAYLSQEVSENSIQKQSLSWDIKIPEKTITISKPTPSKNLWMIGGSLGGNRQDLINQINADLLLITKKQKGYSVGTGLDMNGRVNYRFGLYWKL